MNELFELHWRGDLKVHLKPGDAKGSALENRIQAISFLNYAFELFHAFRQGIAKCSDAKMRERMTQTLEAAAHNGPGAGACDDLREAISHTIAEKRDHGRQVSYQWQSGKLQTYQSFGFHQRIAFEAFGGRRPTVWQSGDVTSAKAAVRFLEDIDRHIGALQARFARIEQRWTLVHRVGLRVQQNRSRLTASQWTMLGGLLSNISRTVFDSQDAMWLSASGIEARFNTATACVGSQITVLGVSRRLEALSARMLEGRAVMGHLKEAMELLCILGTFYARAFDMIPGAKRWINRVEARRWNELRLLQDASPSTRLAEVRTGQAYKPGHALKRSFPMFGNYRETASQSAGQNLL